VFGLSSLHFKTSNTLVALQWLMCGANAGSLSKLASKNPETQPKMFKASEFDHLLYEKITLQNHTFTLLMNVIIVLIPFYVSKKRPRIHLAHLSANRQAALNGTFSENCASPAGAGQWKSFLTANGTNCRMAVKTIGTKSPAPKRNRK